MNAGKSNETTEKIIIINLNRLFQWQWPVPQRRQYKQEPKMSSNCLMHHRRIFTQKKREKNNKTKFKVYPDFGPATAKEHEK